MRGVPGTSSISLVAFQRYLCVEVFHCNHDHTPGPDRGDPGAPSRCILAVCRAPGRVYRVRTPTCAYQGVTLRRTVILRQIDERVRAPGPGVSTHIWILNADTSLVPWTKIWGKWFFSAVSGVVEAIWAKCCGEVVERSEINAPIFCEPAASGAGSQFCFTTV